eukprot:TRINITY_DN2670_c2_g3_i1.p1 TRINITY_DN2670_c2_g3~~TRINITY_DN2670_c2_g3_i1.p1  ORF type:complete len:277 (+),score=47.90 TRINITY_DN2670_c2_g3_i1:139-969(+)
MDQTDKIELIDKTKIELTDIRFIPKSLLQLEIDHEMLNNANNSLSNIYKTIEKTMKDPETMTIGIPHNMFNYVNILMNDIEVSDKRSQKCKTLKNMFEKYYQPEKKRKRELHAYIKVDELDNIMKTLNSAQLEVKKIIPKYHKEPIGISMESQGMFVCYIMFDDLLLVEKEPKISLDHLNFVGYDEKEDPTAYNKRSKHLFYKKVSIEGYNLLEKFRSIPVKDSLQRLTVWIEYYTKMNPCAMCEKYLAFDSSEYMHLPPVKIFAQGSYHDTYDSI